MDTSKDQKIGAVIVQGGGIAGVQASLDLANSGFKVYLVERDAAAGSSWAARLSPGKGGNRGRKARGRGALITLAALWIWLLIVPKG